MKWSIWTAYLCECSFEEALLHLREVGLGHVEVSIEHMNELLIRCYNAERELDSVFAHRNELARSFGVLTVDELRVRIKELGMKLIQAHGPFDISEYSVSKAKRLEKLKLWFKLCNEIEVPVLVLHPLYKEDIVSNLDFFNKVSKIARDYGVFVAIENMGSGAKVGRSIEELKRIIVESNKDYLGICLDTGHAYSTEIYRGHVEKAIYEAQDLLIATHINDHNGKIDHLFPGKGKIRWNLVINAFKEIRYSKPLNLEVPTERKGCRGVEELKAKLKEFLASWLQN